MEFLTSLQKCTLHSHQKDGVIWLLDHWKARQNVIVADEMGLGKTLQSLAFFCYLLEKKLSSGPFLVIAPLSVAPQWVSQARTFVPSLRVFEYLGSGPERAEKRECLVGETGVFDMFVSSYETCFSDIDFVSGFRWSAIVFDEGHRLKNPDGRTHAIFLERLKADFKMILTGTPVQNNFTELWALLRFLNPERFPESSRPNRSEDCLTVSKSLVKTYVLRRLFSAVSSISLPPIDELVIRTEMTDIQTSLYRWALFQYAHSTRGSSEVPAGILSNLLMTLRKIASHPYLIAGVEPEPFAEGEHLWRNSNKFRVLKPLLEKMRAEKSKCLIFSNFTSLLDICQDFLDMQGFAYERLDGSVRRQDRMHAIDRFSSSTENKEVFLLSTRAGGVGLNLTAADWVIFLDSDWNPQMDLQAVARAFRQGQTRRVTVFRLVTIGTVDEVIFSRALEKLKFAQKVLSEEKPADDHRNKDESVKELVLSGIGKLKKTGDPAGPLPRASRERDETETEDVDIEKKIQVLNPSSEQEELVVLGPRDVPRNYKQFEGVDYTPPSSKDIEAMENLKQLVATTQPQRSAPVVDRIRQMTVENRMKRKQDKWREMKYTSFAVENSHVQQVSSNPGGSETGEIIHLIGSFVEPSRTLEENATDVVVHLVDPSGVWPTNSRLFMTLASAFPLVPKHYHQAKKAGDLKLGDLHLIPIRNGLFVALCVTSRGANDDLNLKKSLIKLSSLFLRSAEEKKIHFHFSRIGDKRGTLYLAERIIGNYLLSAASFTAFIYYFRETPKPRVSIMDYFKRAPPKEEKHKSIIDNAVTVHFSNAIIPVLRAVYSKEVSSIGGRAVDVGPADIYVVSVKEGKKGIDKLAVETSMPEIPLKKDGIVRAITSTQFELLLQKSF